MLKPEEKQVLIDLKNVIDPLGYQMLLVGANARRLIFDFPLNISGRATQDLDITIPLENWLDYQTLSNLLTQGKNPIFKTTNTQHRFIHIKTNIKVDIIPCGEIGEPNQEIQWQDDNVMNVMGFKEALENASTQIVDDYKFQVIDTPSFIVLKCFAWHDTQKNRHWQDINFILANYNKMTGIDERIYTELTSELADGKITYQDAAIYLVGKDIQKRLEVKTLESLITILSILIKLFDGYDDERGEFSQRIRILKQGIDS